MFSLPDLYHRDSILDFDEASPEEHELLHDALAVKEAGNQLAIWSGGRSVHAPNLIIGGFSKLPEEGAQNGLIKKLEEIRPRVLKLITIFKNCEFKQEEDFSYSAITSSVYSFLDGDIVKANGDTVPAKEYSRHLEHVVIPYSQAAGYKFKGKIFIVGALSRINLSKDKLHEKTRQDAAEALALFPSKNIYHNNLAQAVEILQSIDESIEILQKFHVQEEKPVTKPLQQGVGVGVIEAPRGTLYHRYHVNAQGIVERARIIVPTGQNQVAIEQSLVQLARSHPELLNEEGKEKLSFEFEKLIRAYDPCMSCASHFLKLKLERC
jgi:coenzyme F420-reducing hydrogenase alpha subunit